MYAPLVLHGQTWTPFVCIFDNGETYMLYAKDKEHAEKQLGALALRPHRIESQEVEA